MKNVVNNSGIRIDSTHNQRVIQFFYKMNF